MYGDNIVVAELVARISTRSNGCAHLSGRFGEERCTTNYWNLQKFKK